MAGAIAGRAAQVVAEAVVPEPRPEPEGARDKRGRFRAPYNELNIKRESDLGPAFRSVEEKRGEVDLGARRLAGESLATITRKNQALLALPFLTDNGRSVQVDDFRAQRGIVEVCGTGYLGETLERFLRDAKYLALSDALLDFHAKFWLEHGPRVEDGEAPAAFFLYIDASNKPLWTRHFGKAGKVSSNGRVMPCLDQVLVHTGTGTPIYLKTFSGHASLVTQAPSVLADVEAKVGTGWTVGKIVVIDAEGCAVAFLRALKESKRDFITLVKPSRVPELDAFQDLSAFEPYRREDEIAEGRLVLTGSGGPYEVRVVLVRRTRAGQLTVLATSVPRDEMPATAIADGYFARWPRQELRFKTFTGAADFKGVKGYGKQRVENVAVVTELEKLVARKTTVEGRITRQQVVVAEATAALTRAKRALNTAKARRKRGDGLVEDALLVKTPNPISVWNRVDALKAERDRLPAAAARVEQATTDLDAAKAKLEGLVASLTAIAKRQGELDSRRTIYRSDVELDQIATVYKLGFALLAETAMRDFFGGVRMSVETFTRQILHLPATKCTYKHEVVIQFACPPDKAVRAALEDACKRVNDLQLSRDGRALRLGVDGNKVA